MILSNVEIHRAIDDGDVVIDPEPLPRFVSLSQPKSPYDTTAVNLRLSPALSVCDAKTAMAFDLRNKGLPELLKKIYSPATIHPQGGYVLEPNLFWETPSSAWRCRFAKIGLSWPHGWKDGALLRAVGC